MNQTKVDRICKKIQELCQDCEGSGCIKCGRQSSRIQKYADAGIPANYWNISFKDFIGNKEFKDLILSKISSINSVFDNGESILFVGTLGTGKTYAISSILKMAVCKDYNVKYCSMVDVINRVLGGSDPGFTNELLNYDFLAIDEFDSRWIFPSEKAEQVFGSTMEYILRTRFQNQLPTLLASNTAETDEILSGSYGKAFSSLKSQYLNVVYVTGKDFRKRAK